MLQGKKIFDRMSKGRVPDVNQILIRYWVPVDGDDEKSPNVYPITRAVETVRLGDIKAVSD